jgi:3-isopropylmalate dehydrogenase
MLLRHSFGLAAEAEVIERAVGDTIASGVRTPDIAAAGTRAASTREVGDAVLAKLG